MLTAYIRAAMRHAHYELLDDQPSDPYYGSIEGLQGVMAIGRTLEECREELQSALEAWIVVGIHLGHTLPVVDGIDLNIWAQPLPEAA